MSDSAHCDDLKLQVSRLLLVRNRSITASNMAILLKKFRKPPTSQLLKLPGEIRNQIYQLCIQDALTENTNSNEKPHLDLAVLPRWDGPGKEKLEGIGPLPVLFVNRQTYKEVHWLLCAMIKNVSIGGYLLQYAGEDASARWEHAYNLLRKWPALNALVKEVTVTLPYVKEDLFKGQWTRNLGLNYPGATTKSNPWLMLPGLVKFLRTFDVLSTLKIVLVAQKADHLDFEELLPLYDVCGNGTRLEVVAPQSGLRSAFGQTRAASSPYEAMWLADWGLCLIKNGRIAASW